MMNRRGFGFCAKPGQQRASATQMLRRSSTWAEPESNYFYAMEFEREKRSRISSNAQADWT